METLQATRSTAPNQGALADQVTEATQQFITCTLGSAEYGIDIMAVREIKGWADTTTIPHAPPWIRGVINLRGIIVPILDLRARFGHGLTAPTPMHVIIIIQTTLRTAGLLVDTVSDIITVAPADIRPLPEISGDGSESLLRGLVPLERGMVALVNIEQLVCLPDDTASAVSSLTST